MTVTNTSPLPRQTRICAMRPRLHLLQRPRRLARVRHRPAIDRQDHVARLQPSRRRTVGFNLGDHGAGLTGRQSEPPICGAHVVERQSEPPAPASRPAADPDPVNGGRGSAARPRDRARRRRGSASLLLVPHHLHRHVGTRLHRHHHLHEITPPAGTGRPLNCTMTSPGSTPALPLRRPTPRDAMMARPAS